MGINILEIKNQNLKELASLVDNSYDGKTRGNGMIDDCELSVFIDKAKKFGMASECAEILGLSKTTQKDNVQNVKAEQIAVEKNTTLVEQGAVKKIEPNKLELKEKIHKKKEEIKQISKKLQDDATTRGLAFGAVCGGLFGLVSGAVGALGEGLLTAACFIIPEAAIFGAIGAGAMYLMFRKGHSENVVGTEELRKRDPIALDNAELTKELIKAEQELQVLEKQYNE